jgi:hypothetical protein
MRARIALVTALGAGLCIGLFAARDPFPILGWFFIACAAAHLVASAVLAAGGSVPEWWGRTALGQALLSEGCLAQGILTLAGHTIAPALGWSAAAIGVVSFCAGLRIESRARRHALRLSQHRGACV